MARTVLATSIALFVTLTAELTFGQKDGISERNSEDWTSFSEGHRINRLKFDLRNDKYEFADLLEPENIANYPLLVGGTKQQFRRLTPLTGKNVTDLINVATRFLHPSQVQALVERIDWSLEANKMARRSVRKFLTVEQVDKDLDSSEDIFDNDNTEVPWAVLLRAAKVSGKFSKVSLDKFVALNTSYELKNVFETLSEEAMENDQDQDIEAITSAASPRLTRGQARVFASEFYRRANASKVTSASLSKLLIPGIASEYFPELFTTNSARRELLEEFTKLSEGQKWMTFLAWLGTNHLSRAKDHLNGVANEMRVVPHLLSYFLPKEIAQSSRKIGLKLRTISFEKKLMVINVLPKYVVEVLGRGKVATADPFSAASLNCADLDELNDLKDLLEILRNHNAVRAASGDLKVFPLSLRSCIKDSILKLTEAKDEFAALSSLVTDDVPVIGGIVLSSFSEAALTELWDFDTDDQEEKDRLFNIFEAIMREIGSLPMADLIPVASVAKVSELKELADIAADGKPVFASYMLRGSLNHVDIEIGDKKSEIGDLNRYLILELVEDRKKLVCLDSNQRAKWALALKKIYGPVKKWHEEDLYQMGDLLITLPLSDLLSIPLESFRKAVPYLISRSNLYDEYDVTPSYSNETRFYKVCADWLGGDDGEAFKRAFMDLQRVYLRLSQLSVNIAIMDDISPRAAVEDGDEESNKQKRSSFYDEELLLGDEYLDLQLPSFRIDIDDVDMRRFKRQASFPNSDNRSPTPDSTAGISNAQAPQADPISVRQPSSSDPPTAPTQSPVVPNQGGINSLADGVSRPDTTPTPQRRVTIGQYILIRVQGLLSNLTPDQTRVNPIINAARKKNMDAMRRFLGVDDSMPNRMVETTFQEKRLNAVTRGESMERFIELQEEWNEIRNNMLRELAPILKLTPQMLQLTEEAFCSFFEAVCKRESGIDRNDKDAEENSGDKDSGEFERVVITVDKDLGLPKELTCHGLRAAGHAKIALTAEDLNWSSKDVYNCLEVIGSIKFDFEQKRKVWEVLLKELEFEKGLGEKLSQEDVLNLGELVEAVASVNPEKLDMNMKYIETWSAVGKFPLSKKSLEELGRQMKSDSKEATLPIDMGQSTNSTLVNVMLIGSMRHLVCALDLEEIKAIAKKEEVMKNALPNLAKIKSCPNPGVLKELAEAAKTILGPTSGWSRAELHFLGVLAAGLSPEDLAKIPMSELDALSPEAVAHMSHETLVTMTEGAMKKLTSEAAAKLTVSQMVDEETGSMLSDESKDILMKMDAGELTGLAETMKQYEALAATATTTTSTPRGLMEKDLGPNIQEATAEGGVSAPLLAGGVIAIFGLVSVIVSCA